VIGPLNVSKIKVSNSFKTIGYFKDENIVFNTDKEEKSSHNLSRPSSQTFHYLPQPIATLTNNNLPTYDVPHLTATTG